MSGDLTTQILIEIRDEIRGTNGRLDETNRRLDSVEQRLDETNHRLDDTNQRLAVLAKITQGIDTRVGRIEAELVFLPRRVDVLEQKVERIEEILARDPKP